MLGEKPTDVAILGFPVTRKLLAVHGGDLTTSLVELAGDTHIHACQPFTRLHKQPLLLLLLADTTQAAV